MIVIGFDGKKYKDLGIGKINGQQKNIVIDTGVFKHNIFDREKILDKKLDIIKIRGSKKKPIDLEDLVSVYSHVNRQFKIMIKHDLDRSYFFEGCSYNKITRQYELHWGS